MSGGVESFVLDAIAPQRWKNGAGSTREIAAHPRGAADFEWRISVAGVDRGAPFSAYAGVDRVIMLLEGEGLYLRGEVSHDLVEPFVPFAFAGEAAIVGEPVAGATTDFNLMTRRGAWRGAAHAHRLAAALPAADAGMLLCVRGRWRTEEAALLERGAVAQHRGELIRLELSLQPGEGLVWRDGRPATALEPDTDDAVLIAVTLNR